MAGTTTQQDFPLSTLGGVSLDDLVKQSVASSPYEARQKAITDKATKVLEEQQSDPKLQKLRDEEKDAAERMAKTAKEKYDDIKPLQVEPWKAKPPENDPLQSFGSIGGAFAMIASAFTHQPMVNALNAGAAAMNAYRANDLRTYEEARRAWKDNMELALERHKEQSEAFKEAMELGKTDVAARDAALQTYAAKYGDQIAALKTEASMVGDLDKIWQSRQQNADRLLQLFPTLDKEAERRSLLLADPDWLSNDPQRKAAALRRATQAMSPFSISSIGAPQEVLVDDGQGGTKKVLAQQDKTTGQWVTADENRAPIQGVKRILTTAERSGEGAELAPETIRTMAEQYLAGDKTIFQNLGRGAQGAKNIVALRNEIQKVMKERGMSGADMAVRTAEFSGLIQAERTAATQSARLGLATAELEQFVPLALDLSNKVDRTKYPTINSMEQAIKKGTGDENIIRFIDSVNALKNAYSQVVTRGSAPTEGARQQAGEVIDTAYSKGQFSAAADQLMKEAYAARQAPETVRRELRRAVSDDTAAPPRVSGAPKDGDTSTSKSGKPIIFRNGQWEYQ